MGGATRRPQPPPEGRGEGPRPGTRGCRHHGRGIALRGRARASERPETTASGRLLHVPSARAGARGVQAGRGGGEGRGPFSPSPTAFL